MEEYLSSPIFTKDIKSVLSSIESSLSSDEDRTISFLSNHFFGADSKIVIKSFLTPVKQIITKKTAKMSDFEQQSCGLINDNFWNSDKPNFYVGLNAINFFNVDFLFGSAEQQHMFVKLICRCYNENLSNEELIAGSKIIEKFVLGNYPINEVEIEGCENVLKNMCNDNSHSFLVSTLLKVVHVQTDFECTFSLIRSIVELISKIITKDKIEILYTEETCELSQLLSKYIEGNLYVLFLSVLTRLFKNDNMKAEVCYKRCIGILNNDYSTMIDKIYGYHSLTQVVGSLSSIDSFLENFGNYLLHDFDSNNLITNPLKTIMKALIKRGKAKKEIEKISNSLIEVISPLSFHSKIKSWLLPLLLPYSNISDFINQIFNELFDLSQDPASAGFVSKCVRTFSQYADICTKLIDNCIESTKDQKITHSLAVLKPILEPIFENQPKLIQHTFEKIEKTPTYINIWQIFQCLISAPRTKWVIQNEELNEYIKIAFNSGNWDLRDCGFLVYNLARYPNNEKDAELLCSYFDHLLYTDSPKHIASFVTIFNDFILRIQTRSKTELKQINEKMLLKLLDTISEHMIPSFISSHRQFAFDLFETIYNSYPSILTQNHFKAIATLLTDANAKLVSSAKNVIYKLVKNEEIYNFYKLLQNENIQNLLNNINNQKQVSETENDLITPLLDKLKEEKQWNEQCVIFQEIVDKIDENKTSVCIIEKAANTIFEIVLNTRILGIACNGQNALEYISSLLPSDKLEKCINEWSKKLLSILDGFDMENMRRSAALPFLAQSLLRLQPPTVMKSKQAIFEKLINSLINLLDKTESLSEATNSLNVIRAILTDKVTSPIEDSFLSSVFLSAFNVCQRLNSWDLITAANLCCAAVIRKVMKNSLISGNGFKLDQFFCKMPNSRETILKCLNSSQNHLIYLSLMILGMFSSIKTDQDLFDASKKFLSSRFSRTRRTAARACVNVIAKEERPKILIDTVANLKMKGFNLFHGEILLIKELLLSEDIKIPDGINFNLPYPVFQIPPFIYRDLFFVMEKLNSLNQIPDNEIVLNNFVYDQAQVFKYKGNINQDVNTSLLVALLSTINPHNPPKDLLSILVKIILTPEMNKLNKSLVFLGIDFICKQKTKVVDSEVLVSLIKNDFPPEIIANLIHILKYSNPTKTQLSSLFDLFIKYVYNLSEELTHIHIAIAEILPLLLFDLTGYFLAYRLIIDDVPKVRTLTIKALSKELNVDFSSEIVLIEKLNKKLADESPKTLYQIIIKWISLIQNQIDNDTHGESLTIFVDEFYVVREALKSMGQEINFDKYPSNCLLNIRKAFIDEALKCIEKNTN